MGTPSLVEPAAAPDLLDRRARVMPRGIPMLSSIALARSEGALLIDVHGREYIDLAGGIGVMAVGHSHPRVVAAIQEQAARLQHSCIHVATYEPYVALCEKLVSILPHGGPTKAMLVNSGAEAVENAVKIARQATGRAGVVCYTGGFHGRTLLGMSLTSKAAYKEGCGPFAPETYRLPFPDFFQLGDGLSGGAFVRRELDRFRDALHTVVGTANLAAVLIEPVLGEGGFVPAPQAYLQGLREICDEHGIVLIFDEVQTGFGRTGAWGAFQRLGVVPDLSTWAKSMGGGMPISSVIGKAGIMDAARPGTIGGTYGGNPVACASALAAISVIEDEGLLDRSIQIGEVIRDRFTALAQTVREVVDVRGMGAMMALELCESGDRTRPAGALLTRVRKRCEDDGVIVIGCGTYGNVLRILCPLNIARAQLLRALDVIDDAVRRECT